MKDKDDIVTVSEGLTSKAQTLQIGVRMQQGEHTGQPIYSNFTAVQTGQGVIILDFGFLDPQTVKALNTMVQSGQHVSEPITAKLSCRMAISIDAVNQLSQQLNQLFNVKTESPVQANQHNRIDSKVEANLSNEIFDNVTKQKSEQSGFRFPWSKKTH